MRVVTIGFLAKTKCGVFDYTYSEDITLHTKLMNIKPMYTCFPTGLMGKCAYASRNAAMLVAHRDDMGQQQN